MARQYYVEQIERVRPSVKFNAIVIAVSVRLFDLSLLSLLFSEVDKSQ